MELIDQTIPQQWEDQSPAPSSGPEYLIKNAKDGTLLVLVPAGKFLAGDPVFEVELPAYYMALHPVTNGQYGRFVKAARHRAPDNKIWQEAGKSDHPVTDVSWDDAQVWGRPPVCRFTESLTPCSCWRRDAGPEARPTGRPEVQCR